MSHLKVLVAMASNLRRLQDYEYVCRHVPDGVSYSELKLIYHPESKKWKVYVLTTSNNTGDLSWYPLMLFEPKFEPYNGTDEQRQTRCVQRTIASVFDFLERTQNWAHHVGRDNDNKVDIFLIPKGQQTASCRYPEVNEHRNGRLYVSLQ